MNSDFSTIFSVKQYSGFGIADGRRVSGYEEPTRQAISFPEAFSINRWKSPRSNNPSQDTRIITAIADNILFIMNMMKNDRFWD